MQTQLQCIQHVAYNVCQISEPQTMEEALIGDHARECMESSRNLEYETWELNCATIQWLKAYWIQVGVQGQIYGSDSKVQRSYGNENPLCD